ncbi:MAG: zinc-ribbon domain-containing protein [Desulfobacterales bacterium]|nr:zinc-ribbon domain-containing protein [Desulfobacterales bacterium]
MIVICEECGKKYRIDPAKANENKISFKCKNCGHQIMTDIPNFSVKETDSNDLSAVSSISSSESKNESVAEETSKTFLKTQKRNKKKKDFRFGLIAKVVTPLLIVGLVPLAIFWGITFKQTTDRIRSDTENLSAQISLGLANHVDEWIDKNVRVLKSLSKMADIVSMDRMQQEAFLKIVQKEYPWMYLVFTTDVNGINVARNDDEPLKDYSDRQYYKEVMSGKELAWQTLIGKTSKKPALVLAVPIKEGDKIVGVMASAMGIDAISQLIANWKQGETGYAFLVDEKGKVVAHQNQQYALQSKNLSAHPLVMASKNGRSGAVYFENELGESSLGHARKTNYGWVLAIQQEEKEMLDILKQAQYFAYLLLGITILAVLFIAYLSGRAIVNPIRRLTNAADRISIGELDVKIESNSKDEIGDLAQAIVRMQESIRLSIERLRRRRVA